MKTNIEFTEDDLNLKGYKIFQLKNSFKFGIDAVLLANFVKVKKDQVGVDLCTGSGIIPTIILAKSNVKNIIGVEIDFDTAELSNLSIQKNHLEDRFKIINDNIVNVKKYFAKDSVDFITVNPPYYMSNSLMSNNDKKSIARNEVYMELEDVFKISKYLLKSKKSLYMIHKPERLVDIFEYSRKHHIEPKEIKFIYPKKDTQPNLVLIKFTKDGNKELKYLDPIYVYNDVNEYSEEIINIYSKESLEI